MGQVLRIEEINFMRCLILFSDKSVAEFYILFDFKISFLRICPLSRLSSLFPRSQKNNRTCPLVSFKEIKRFKYTNKEVVVEFKEV